MNSTPSSTRPPEPARCPRCGGGFDCGAKAGYCDCFGIALDEALRAELRQRWPGQCLCLSCLRELKSGEARP